ncbi:ATP synthase subunit I [Salinicola halophilus]|uniref:ATP synthase subunit I n=1 Tax=Salinicola halophilus TaxID=184065 RepID=UPI000DA227A6|nr:ATP synthase subunit I [Salinicola halophilus]
MARVRGPARYPRPSTTRLIVCQVVVIGTLSVIAAALGGGQTARDAVMGGLVSLIPSFYFAWRLFGQSQRLTGAAGRLYKAEAGKFGLTVALFAIVFALVPPSNPTFFFLTYVATIAVHWLAPWLVRRQSSPRN